MIIAQSGSDEFYIGGSGLTILFFRDPDLDAKLCGVASLEEVDRVSGKWTTIRHLNGDQSNQGRQLSMAPHEVHIYRVSLYAVDSNSKQQ